MTTTIATYAVTGMSCQHCVDAVTAEVLRGIEHGSTFNSSVTVDHLAERLGVHPRELTG